jgi:putative transposase
MKKKKKIDDKEIYRKQILKHNKDIWKTHLNIKLNDIKQNTWFSIKESCEYDTKYSAPVYKEFTDKKLDKTIFKCKQVILHLNYTQKLIINKWLISYCKMYNEALKYIKKSYITDKKYSINFYKLRKNLKNIKTEILDNSQLDCKKNTQIATHDLDSAIKLACVNYKSALTNFKNGNINNFRIRYWNYNKSIQIMDLEKCSFKNNTIRKIVLGMINATYNGNKFDFKVKHDCKLRFNKNTNEYILYVPEEVKKTNNDYTQEIISLDPGIRTFMTGISEEKIIKIGEKCTNRLKTYFNRIDKINKNEDIHKNKKNKLEKKYNKKMTNLVDEMHWKTINYLTINYKTILIGNMSTKEIVSNKVSNITNMTKRLGLKLKFYQFSERLKYKCNLSNRNYKMVNESYTSKMCSRCGNMKNDLGSNNIYNCTECNLKIDRDINGARGIFIKSITE